MEDSTIMKVIDLKKPEEGIKELRYIDPMKMQVYRTREKKKDRNAFGPQQNEENHFNAFPEIEEYFHILHTIYPTKLQVVVAEKVR